MRQPNLRGLSNLTWLLPVVLAAAAACSAGSNDSNGGGGGGTVTDGGPGTMATANQFTIAVSPDPIQVTVDGADVQVPLHAVSSAEGDVTTKAGWSVVEPVFGSVDAGGVLTVPKTLAKGGKALVTATYGGQVGSAELQVLVKPQDVVDPSAPPDVKGWFDNGDGGTAPNWVYPYDHTMVPKNQPELTFMWNAVAGAGAYRLRFESPTYVRNVYVGASVCAGSQCQYQIADQQWIEIAEGLAGSDANVTISASEGPDAQAGVAAQTVSFSPDTVLGGLYYWSTSITGLYRAPLGAKKATAFITNGNETGCAGCHAVSPDGKKVALEFGSAEGIAGGIVSGDNGQQYILPPDPSLGLQWNLQTFSPDGNMLLINWHGTLRVIDTNTGSFLYSVPALDGPWAYAQPEWSPDGQNIVFVRMPAGTLEWDAQNTGDIMIMPFNNGAFGPPTMILEAAATGELHFYPTWSPDGQWIIFNSCMGCGTYNSSGTRLRMIRAAAGNTPIELTRATHMLNSNTNWPRSAPFLQKNGTLMFFTFSTTAPYGFSGGGNPQVWMAAIDLDAAANGTGDPSYAPYWLTFQIPTENNHLGTWTKAVVCDDPTDCPSGFTCEEGECVPIIVPS